MKINYLTAIEADEENGGRLVAGAIIGARRTVKKWQIDDEAKLYDDRRDAELEIKRRTMHAEFMNLVMAEHNNQPLNASEVAGFIRRNGKALKAILQERRYADLIG